MVFAAFFPPSLRFAPPLPLASHTSVIAYLGVSSPCSPNCVLVGSGASSLFSLPALLSLLFYFGTPSSWSGAAAAFARGFPSLGLPLFPSLTRFLAFLLAFPSPRVAVFPRRWLCVVARPNPLVAYFCFIRIHTSQFFASPLFLTLDRRRPHPTFFAIGPATHSWSCWRLPPGGQVISCASSDSPWSLWSAVPLSAAAPLPLFFLLRLCLDAFFSSLFGLPLHLLRRSLPAVWSRYFVIPSRSSRGSFPLPVFNSQLWPLAPLPLTVPWPLLRPLDITSAFGLCYSGPTASYLSTLALF